MKFIQPLMLRRLRKIMLSMLLALVVLVALLTSVVSTSAGSRWLVSTLATALQIELGSISGNLLTGLDISYIDYHHDKFSAHAEKLSIRWQPIALFYTSLSIQSLSATNVQIHWSAPAQESEPEHYEWPSFAQPLSIELGKLQLTHIELQQDDIKVPLTAIEGSLSLGSFHLRVSDVAVQSPQGKIILNGTMNLRYPYALDAKSQWEYTAATADAVPLSGRLSAHGNIKKITLEHDLIQPVLFKTTAVIAPALHDKKNKPTAEIVSDWAEQPLPDLLRNKLAMANQSATVVSTQGHLALKGWLDGYDIVADLQAKTKDTVFSLTGNGKNENVLAHDKSQLHFNGLTLAAKPINSAADMRSESSIKLSGDVDFFKIPSPAVQWALNINGEHINAEYILADWPSDLSVNGKISGRFSSDTALEKKWQAAFQHIDIHGELRNLAANASGELNYDGESWHSSAANLEIGANQLILKGSIGKTLALEWKINAPLLNQIDPGLTGSILSSGNIMGDFTNPALQIAAQINQVAWRNYTIDNLTLKLTPKDKSAVVDQSYELILDAAHLQLQGQRISHASLKGSGALAQHFLDGTVESPEYGVINFSLDSRWRDAQWQGHWKSFSLDVKKIPRWYLSSSSLMLANQAQADFGDLCLTTTTSVTANTESLLTPNALPQSRINNSAPNLIGESTLWSKIATQEVPNLCIHSQWAAASGFVARANIVALPIRNFYAWFKSDVILQGMIDGQINLRSDKTKPIAMDAHLQSRDVQFMYQFQGGNTEVYPLQKGTADFVLKNNVLTAEALSDWGKYGVINGDAKYNVDDKKILGKVSVALSDLAPLESLLPFLNNVQGSATAAFNLAGTIDKPELQGKFSLVNGRANLPRLGLELKDISVQMTSVDSDSIHVEGKITSGDGSLMVKGDLDNLGTPQWQWQSNIYGANISVVQQPQLGATVSPNLQLSAKAEAINLIGSTEIPWARVALKTLPASATRVSNDVTIVESKASALSFGDEKKSIPFYTNIILYFGDDVRFKGFGLDSQLTGKINVLKEENRQTLTTGFVAVGKGNYKAYGQDLSIERGRLIFQGPYDNPGLDIRALRVMENVTAGLDIGGTLQRPKSKVFSIPATTDSEAMAVLLTGKPLAQSSHEDAVSILGAISSLGMDQGQSMTTDIAHFFRVDEIAIKSDKGLEQSALWMGKYITPKLFIRYMVGLFDQTFTLGMRYQLNEKLRLEAESGKTQSVDIIYKIER